MKDQQTINVLKALADPTRLKLVRSLFKDSHGQKSCSDLSAKSCLSQPAMSHHFSKLATAGVISETKIGTQKTYILNNDFLNSLGLNIQKL